MNSDPPTEPVKKKRGRKPLNKKRNQKRRFIRNEDANLKT